MRLKWMGIAVLGALLCGGCGEGGGATPATVMTQNLYYGTEFDDAIAALMSGDEEAFVVAVTEAWGRVQWTDFPVRAEALADQIVAAGPDVIGLQEAALWRVQSPADPATPATTVAYDFVQILLDALATRGATYEVAATFTGLDVEFPYLDESFELDEVRLTDREVILVRRGGDIAWGNPATGAFAVNLPIPPGIEVLRGWASIDVNRQGKIFRFLTTHLEADEPTVRALQAQEIVGVAQGSPLPVVLVGDFNYDLNGSDPDMVAFLQLVQGAGLQLAAPTGAADVTCCADEFLSNPETVFTERLDLIFSGPGITVAGGAVLGNTPDAIQGGLWPADHAAVAALLSFP